MDIDPLIETVGAYSNGPEARKLLQSAFRMASEAHRDFRRIDGEPFLNHPLAVATILAEWHAPPYIVAVGLLHDLNNLDYSVGYSLDGIENELGSDVRELLQVMIHLNGFFRQTEWDLAGANNGHGIDDYVDSIVRWERDAIIIKVADRLHNLQTISSLTRDFQERAARVGINLLVPLTDRLGIADVRHQLENYSFAVMHPKYYGMFEQHYILSLKEIEEIRCEMQQALVKALAHVEVSWLPASLYNLYCRHVEQNTKLGRPIHADLPSLKPLDMGSLLILLDEEIDCYRILGTLHKFFVPIEGQFRDFIGNPKENGYRALHTQVRHSSGAPMQIFIRTHKMDLVARRGIVSRWSNIPEELLPQLPEEAKHLHKELQVFTSNDEVKYLTHGATLLDYAYEIYPEVGHRCTGALINGGECAELYRPLQPGDKIEIKLGDATVEPQLDALEHARTSHAINRIRMWFAQNKREDMLTRGRELLIQALQQQGMHTYDDYIQQLLIQIGRNEQYRNLDDLLVAIGVGRQKVSKVVVQIRLMRSLEHGNMEADMWPVVPVGALSPQKNILRRSVAKCCHPIPLDDIVGYHRKRDQVLIIHKRTCPQIKAARGLVPVKWEELDEGNYVVVIEAVNRYNLVADLSRAVQRQACDMWDYSVARRADGFLTEAHIYLGKTTVAQRARLKKDLENVPYVISVEIIASSQSSPIEVRQSSKSATFVTSSLRAQNPYGPRPALGSRFYGRERECQRIYELLQDKSRSTTILLWGQKRIGKSSLLLSLNERFRASFLPVFIDVQSLQEASTLQFLYHLMLRTAEVVNTQAPNVRSKLVVPDLKRLRKDILVHFDTFLSRVQECARHHPIVIILDEFQCLCSLREEQISRDAIFSRLRSHAQHGQSVHFILSGGGLMSQLINQVGLAALFSSISDEKLGCLERAAATQLIKDGLTQVGFIEEDAVNYLLNMTAGHPFYLQLLCRKLYEYTQEHTTGLTREFVATLTQEWVSKTDASRFQHLWEANSRDHMQRNKFILSAIAQLSIEQGYTSYESIAHLVCPLVAEHYLLETLRDLVELGVLKQNRLSYGITVELFACWLRQRWPFELVLKETHFK
jgi:GTP pyrophosphokinase